MPRKRTTELAAEPCVVHADGTVSDRELWAEFLEEDARPHPWDTTCAEQAARRAAESDPTEPSAPPTPHRRKTRR